MKAREIFLSQPILLELEAPLKICGEIFSLMVHLTLYTECYCTWGYCVDIEPIFSSHTRLLPCQ